jgi:hypothetical protein
MNESLQTSVPACLAFAFSIISNSRHPITVVIVMAKWFCKDKTRPASNPADHEYAPSGYLQVMRLIAFVHSRISCHVTGGPGSKPLDMQADARRSMATHCETRFDVVTVEAF